MAKSHKFTFIDLFSGIGGFHQACASLGGKCLLACDIDPQARQVYLDNYGIEPVPDITKLKRIPKCDVLCAGFPCVTFSTIGKRAGTTDPRGRLFFEIMRLVKRTPPRLLIFENVKGLLYMPDEFNAFKSHLQKLKYQVTHALLDAQDFGVPQHRERVFIVASRSRHPLPPIPTKPIKPPRTKFKTFNDIRDAAIKTRADAATLVTRRFKGHMLKAPIITNKGRTILRARINNFINKKLFSSNGIVGTLCATFTPYVYDERLKIPRRMTPREMLRCQGFPDSFNVRYGRSITARLAGNAVCVNVARHVTSFCLRQNSVRS